MNRRQEDAKGAVERDADGVQDILLTRAVCVRAGGKLRYLTVKKAAAAPKCGDCHIALPGVRPRTLFLLSSH